MILRPNSGVARISAIWMIVVVVLFFVAIAFAFVASSDLSSEKDLKVAARVERDAAKLDVSAQANLKRDISLVLGWVPPDAVDPTSDLEGARLGLERLRDTFTDLESTDSSFESVITKIISAFNARGQSAVELQARIATLESEVLVANGTVSTVTGEKDNLISGLRQQQTDEAQNAAQRQADLEERLRTAQSQTAERDLELRQATADLQASQRGWDLEKQRLEARILELGAVAKFAKEPFNQYPDGKILEVSQKLPLGWINIGANQRLTRGTRFRVENGTPGVTRFKAWAEVTRVDANRAEVTFDGLADRFDPVVAGDVIINPLYDPTGGRNAVLCGRFSGSFNERELRLLLDRMGIVVQPTYDRTTHFLIVGSELWTDPDTDEPLDEPIQPSELAVYKTAEANLVQIIPLQDIREFFRVDSGIAGN
jgi:hypothetical protein